MLFIDSVLFYQKPVVPCAYHEENKSRKHLFYVLEIFVRIYLKKGFYSKKCLKSIYLA